MKNIKKTLSFVLLLIFACSMLIFGCGDKYANLKVTTDAPENGISLYMGKDTENQILSVASFTATVSGAGENTSTKLKYRFSNENRVSISTEYLGEQTKFTVTALDYGSTTLTIFPEEADHITTTVNITVVKEVEALNLYTSYKPFVFTGSSATIDTAKAISYAPADTSQKEVTYSMVGQYQGVTVEPNGKIIATEEAASGSFQVIATSVDNPSISSQPITVRVFKPIKQNDITISFSDGKESLILSTSIIPEEVTKMVTFKINTQEEYFIDEPIFTGATGEILQTEKVDNNNFKVTGLNAGVGSLLFNIALVDEQTVYQNTKLEISVPVQVNQYASNVKINGQTNALSGIYLYDTYQNQRGQSFLIQVAESNAQDKRFVVSLNQEDLQKVTIVDSSNKEILPYSENGNFDILDNNTTLFARINADYEQESQVTINFIAYGTLGLLCEPISNSITADLKHGVDELVVKTHSLTKHIDNMYLLGIDTTPQDDTHVVSIEVSKDQFTSFVKTKVTGDFVEIQDKIDFTDAYTSSTKTIFDFAIKGKAEGISSIEFVAENGIYSIINIRVYNKINAFQVTTETINQNSSIGEVKYDTELMYNETPIKRNSLSKLAIALNGEVKLGIIPIYFDGLTAYNVTTKYLLKCDVDGSDCVSYLNNNILVAKKLTDEPQTLTVSMTVYNDAGEFKLPDQTIQIEVFYEIKEVFLNDTYKELYTYDDLAIADKDKASHEFKLFYNNGIDDIQIQDNILWQVGGPDQSSIDLDGSTATAKNLSGGRDTGLATLTAIYVKYGRTYIVQANIQIIKAVRVSDIYNLSYTKDGKTTLLTKQNVLVSEIYNSQTGEIEQNYEENYYIYLDARSGISKGTTFTLGQTIEPNNAYNKSLIYNVKNVDANDSVPVLLIDENGKVTINRTGGTAYIYISAKDSEQTDGSYSIEKRIFVKIADGNSSVTALEISNEYDLLSINNNIDSLTKYYQVTKDINISNLTSTTNWTPLGIINGQVHEFSGNISGKIINKGETYICTISGFNINCDSSENVLYGGLFATLSQNAVISNLNLAVGKVNINHTATDNESSFTFGGLASVNKGQIKNVSVQYPDTNSQIVECAYISNIGGLVGINYGEIFACYASGLINHTKQNSLTTSNTNIGGLVGLNDGQLDGNSKLVNDNAFADKYTSLISIDSAYKNENNITTYSQFSGTIAVGGVVGHNSAEVVNSSFDGNIIAINNVGGVVGKNSGMIENCFSSGHVNGFGYVGGVVGSSLNGTINLCATNMFDDNEASYQGEIIPNIIGRNDNIGGLVGSLINSQLTNSYVKTYYVRTTDNYLGDIFVLAGAKAQNIGGLIGYAKDATVNKSFSQLKINTVQVDAYVGGLIGGAETVEITNCYTMGNIYLKDSTNSFAGKMIGLLISNSTLQTSHSTIADDSINTGASSSYFVGQVSGGNLTVQNSFHLSNGTTDTANGALYTDTTNGYAKTSSDLQDIYTFNNWSISNNLTSGNDWYIDGSSNNGYPMLVINQNKLGVEAPTEIVVELNTINNYMQKLDHTNSAEDYDGYAILWRGSDSISVKLIDKDNGLFKSITVKPQDAGMAYTITSSDESIVRISGRNKDRIVPVANGEAILTITSRLNNTISKKIKIYVVNKVENFDIDKNSISSLVNQKQIVGISAQNVSNYRLKIFVYGGNNQYLNINNKTISNDSIIDIAFTNNLYVYSTKSITDNDFKITITPYIVVAGNIIELQNYAKTFDYSSYYGIKEFTCNLDKIEFTENDSARLVYTATGDDLRVAINGNYVLPGLTFEGNLNNPNGDLLSFVAINPVVYDSAGNQTKDYQNNQISKIVYEYIIKVNKPAFDYQISNKVDLLELDLTAIINLSANTNEKVEGTFASADTHLKINKQKLKNVAVEFFTQSQKIKNEQGEEVYTVNEASSHKIIAGKTGLLKISLYPNTAEINEVKVYSTVNGSYNISMSQLLKRPVYDKGDTTKINSYVYVERKPYAISLADKNGLLLWNESNIDKDTTFDGTYYVGLIIPSSVPEGTNYTINVEAYLKDGRTIIQTYDLYSDKPSEVSISYNFEGMQTLTDTAYVAYGIDHTLTIAVAKLAVEEKADKSGIKGLTITSTNGIVFAYNNFTVDGSIVYVTYTFNVDDTSITSFEVYVTIKKSVNGQETVFKSNTMTFKLRDFVVKSLDIVTNSDMSDTLSLATNISKELKVKIEAQYDTTKADIATQITNLENEISKNINSWQAKSSAGGTFEVLAEKSYPNFEISRNPNDFIEIKPTKSSSGEEIYVAISLDYDNNLDIGAVDVTGEIGFGKNKQTSNKQSLITKITTNFFQDVSETSSIPVGNLIDETLAQNTDEEKQKLTQTGEVQFEQIQNGTADGKLYYRLKEDIVLTDYTPLELKYVEFDGNGYTITIKSFSEEALSSGNLGLFNTIDTNTLLSNLKVKYDLPVTNEELKTTNQLDYTLRDIEPSTIYFGGLVAINNGIIYNCKTISCNVEIKTIASTTNGTEAFVGGLVARNTGTISFSQSSLNISVNRGYVGGFASENTGKISNSKVIFNGAGITNTATTELSTLIGGFVARNSGKIFGSYIAGTNLENSRYTDTISSYTPVGAFANTNTGEISNSFANIKVVCQTRSSGFVYENAGKIQSCYTASKMIQNSSAHNPFVGVGESGINNTSSISDCYYLNDSFGSTSQDPATKLKSLKEKSNFAGFVFAEDGKLNGTWYMSENGPTLVDANLNIVSERNYEGVKTDAKAKQYYAWIFKDNSPESGQVKKDKYNFRTITDFNQFNAVIHYTDVDNYTTNDYFVLLCDIICDDYVTPNSAELSFTGTLIGNNMTISNLYLKAENTNTNLYFGLFGELKDATIKDLTIKAKQATANNTSYVGILAGRIIDSSNITNISIDGSSVYVQGKYFVGGIAGYVDGDSNIIKVNVSTTVNASYRGTEQYAKVFDTISDGDYELTYSGIAVGVLTGSSTLKDVTITGNSIAIGYYASACVGLVDSGSTLSLANVQIDPNQYVRAYYVAGGLVAENRGTIERCSISHEDNIQTSIDTSNSTSGRNLGFFVGSPQIIGGLVGFNNGGNIRDSFSKLDVRAETLATKVAGGLVGTIIGGTINTSYATGSVVGRRVVGGLIGSVTSKNYICYVEDQNGQQTNTSAVFEDQNKIADSKVTINNVLASNRWLTTGYNDLNTIEVVFQKGLLIGCFNRTTNIETTNCFVNTQVTQNTTKVNIDNFVNAGQNAVLVAFNNGNDINSDDFPDDDTTKTLTQRVIQALSCGEYTTNFDGTSSGETDAPSIDIKMTNNGTYITFYFLNNFDSNMSVITSDGKLNTPTNGVSIYPTIIKNINA